MADTIKTKRITDLPEDTDVNDNDLFMAGSNGTASLRKKKWSTILSKIKSKLLANNLTTTAEGYALDARQGKALKDQVDQLNTKISWTLLFSGERQIADNSTPWHSDLTFASFDIVVIDFVMHNHHKMIPFYVGHVDNQTFMDSWGYQLPGDPVHRIVTLTVGISGRYFANLGAKMLYGNSYQWSDCLQSVYVDKIWGLNCIN